MVLPGPVDFIFVAFQWLVTSHILQAIAAALIAAVVFWMYSGAPLEVPPGFAS